MKKITYQTNRQLWTLQNALASAGYSKTADCYWSQIYTSANGNEIVLDRDEDTTNDPATDLAEMLTPSTTMERITRTEFEKLPREWKEPWHDYWGDHPEWLGKWTSFLPGHGTTLFIEGVSFEIVEEVTPA